MIYCVVALVIAVIAAAWLGVRASSLRRALRQSEDKRRELQRERAIRQNLQRLCDRRGAELHRLRDQVEDYEARFQEMETRASDLNVSLFRESGLRILAEKEEGAKRMKMEQLESQLDAASRRLRETEDAARETEKQLREQIARLEADLARLRAPQGRRSRRAADNSGLDQVTLDDLLGGN